MKLSIIITSFKRAGLLNCHLQCLERQHFSFLYEIIVVNDGPEDETETVCELFKNKLNIKYLFTGQRHKKGGKQWRVPGFAINAAVRKALGENIIITCAEMILLEDDTISLMVKELEDNPKALVITDGRHDDEGKFKKIFERQGPDFDRNMYDHVTLSPLTTTYPFYMALRKKEFVDIGGYDEDFIGNAYDDNDIVDRLTLNKCVYEKLNRRVIHMFHPTNHSTKDWAYNQKIYNSKKGTIIRNQNQEWGKLED